MSIILSRRSFVIGGVAATSTLYLTRTLRAQEPLKIGFVYVGPIGDHGYTYAHELGRQEVERQFGDKVKTTYVENVPEGPDAERVIRQLASTGHQLIFATSFGFMNPTARVARQFPNVKFEHATGYTRGPNLAIYNGRFYEGRAVLGTIAGHMSKSGIAGYVASFPIPEVVMGINAFALAAQKVRPDMKVRVVWVNSWYDPGKEGDAAKALIDQGADMILQHTDSPAPLQVAESRGVHGFGQSSDMSRFAPNAHLTAIVNDWGKYYVERVQAVLDGTWEATDVWAGMKDGVILMAPYNPAMPEEVKAAADATKDGIIAGTLHPFAGPIRNQKGEVVVPEGTTMTDEELLKMDWFVQGVQA